MLAFQSVFELRRLAALALLAAPLAALAQSSAGGGVGIGTTTPSAAAVLDLTATGKGLLIPRMDSLSRARIASPPDGLMVFQTDGRAGFWYAMSGRWLFIPDRTRAADNLGNHTATRSLNLSTNALVGSADSLASAGVGVRADGGLNLGQYTAGNGVFVGFRAGRRATGANNQMVGYQSGYRTTSGTSNTFAGAYSGFSNLTGTNNTFAGTGSGYANTTGSSNEFSGIYSGFVNTTGSGNTFVGTSSGSGNITGSNNWAFGYTAGFASGALTNAGAIGYAAQVSQSNSLVLGGTGPNAVRVGIGTTAPRGTLDVAGTGNTYLVNDPGSGTANQTAYLPGHLFLAPYSGPSGTAYIQARVPSPGTSTSIGLTLRTTDGGALVDALTLAPNGTAQVPNLLVGGTVTAGLLDAGFSTQTADFTVPVGIFRIFRISCPAGTRLIAGGGGNRDLTSDASDLTVNYSGPDPAAINTTWAMGVSKSGVYTRTVRVYCNCARIQ